MPIVELLRALAVAGPLASRAFVPLLVLAGIARWPEAVTWIPFCPSPPVTLPPGLEWLSSTWALAGLAALSALELWADKDPDAREALDLVAPVLKAAAAVAAALMVLDPASTEALRSLAGDAPAGAGLGLGAGAGAGGVGLAALARPIAIALSAGLLTWMLNRWRTGLLEHVRHAGDDIGVSRLTSWAEDAWALGGIVLLIAAPLLAIVAALILGGALWLAQRAADAHAESRRVPCPACGTRARPEATSCVACRTPLAPSSPASSAAWPDRWPDAVLGRSPGAHALDLLARGRCPSCAETRPPAEILSDLPHACGWPGGEWRLPLRNHVRRRALRLMVPALLMGLVPIVGPAAGLVLGRLRVAAPLRRYLPASARFRARWTFRLIAIVLLVGAAIPLVSAIASALLVAVQEWIWGRAFDRAGAGNR
jgi:hypothetical protein